MSREEISVHQWQEQFKAGAFNSSDIHTQCTAGWYDWFCQDHALAGRLKKIMWGPRKAVRLCGERRSSEMSELSPQGGSEGYGACDDEVMGITDPFILDNYYVCFKNNSLTSGQMYDDARFEPLEGERNGKYFLVSLDSPHERAKWSLFTERYGFDAPEFDCRNIREMVQYINGMGRELAQGVQPGFLREKQAVVSYLRQHNGAPPHAVYREGPHLYSYYQGRRSPLSKRLLAAYTPETLPHETGRKDMERVGGIYVFGDGAAAPAPQKIVQKDTKRKAGPER